MEMQMEEFVFEEEGFEQDGQEVDDVVEEVNFVSKQPARRREADQAGRRNLYKILNSQYESTPDKSMQHVQDQEALDIKDLMRKSVDESLQERELMAARKEMRSMKSSC